MVEKRSLGGRGGEAKCRQEHRPGVCWGPVTEGKSESKEDLGQKEEHKVASSHCDDVTSFKLFPLILTSLWSKKTILSSYELGEESKHKHPKYK